MSVQLSRCFYSLNVKLLYVNMGEQKVAGAREVALSVMSLLHPAWPCLFLPAFLLDQHA
ncbi:hypothetical protein AA11826_1938 [Komagataeibacter oboediens DSM 11826]|nr:hypothetical protein AA11826_1938 [Komagataeibacter oboediens DSM 11826]